MTTHMMNVRSVAQTLLLSQFFWESMEKVWDVH
jgi:hypothetical protein